MKALTFQGKQAIRYETVADPSILEPTDAIVKVQLTAICGSDLHVYHERETGLDCGTVMGHEFVGEVMAVGKAVQWLKKGDSVVSPFTTNCGQCYYCTIGLTCRCEYGQLFGWVQDGHGLHGAQAEYVRVPFADHTLVNFATHIPAKEALFTGDIFSTGYYCADMANIQKGGTYVVVGCGPVGLMAVIGAKELGAKRLYAIDSVAERLAQAETFGAIPLNYQQQDAKSVILKATKGRGADAVMEAVGSPAASRLAYELVRAGGIISTVGVHTSEQFAFSPVAAYDKNLTFKIGRCPARFYMSSLLDVVLAERKYNLSSIITHELPLSEGVNAYDIFDQKKEGCLKVVLRP